jgi:hypothetical protein
MSESKTFESYPLGSVVLSNVVSLSIYGLGFFILFRSGWILAILYLIFIFSLEIRLIKNHCTACYYWGKTCGFGKGRISSLFFKKGDASKFCGKQMTWKDMIPDMLVFLFPFLGGIVLLIIQFDYLVLISLLVLLFLTFPGNGYIRGKLTCPFCKQRELGCPANDLFKKKNE